jgi:hypothetical protein
VPKNISYCRNPDGASLHVGTRGCAPSDSWSKMAKWKHQIGCMQLPVEVWPVGPGGWTDWIHTPIRKPFGPIAIHELVVIGCWWWRLNVLLDTCRDPMNMLHPRGRSILQFSINLHLARGKPYVHNLQAQFGWPSMRIYADIHRGHPPSLPRLCFTKGTSSASTDRR